MSHSSEPSALAALAIIESLLLALSDNKTLSKNEIIGVLSDAASVHESPPLTSATDDARKRAAVLINRMIAGMSSAL